MGKNKIIMGLSFAICLNISLAFAQQTDSAPAEEDMTLIYAAAGFAVLVFAFILYKFLSKKKYPEVD